MKISSFVVVVLCLVGSLAHASPNSAVISNNDLQTRFDRLQSVARSGVPAMAVETISGKASLFTQRGDGVVRLPTTLFATVKDSDVTDALMLIALSQATNNPAKPAGVSNTTRTLATVASFVGSAVAENRAILAGRNPSYETTGIYQPGNSVDAPPAVNPVIRAMMWAKASGGCEARIVEGLNELAKGSDFLAVDARKIVKALGATAWSPDTRCR
jgi:hypothetical protein